MTGRSRVQARSRAIRRRSGTGPATRARAADLERVWKALADPTRRQVLDLLREAPRTTGDVAEAFPNVTRFAVMKHLRVLVAAGLVVVRRRGRERWNRLNPVRLHQLYERWLEPYEAEWARRLLRLKRGVENTRGKGEGSMASEGIRTIEVEHEIEIAAPAERVFEALTGDLSDWWGAPYLFAPELATTIVLEPRLGGRLLETWKNHPEEGGLWAVVTELKRNERVELTGRLGMPGAFEGIVRFLLEEVRGRTMLQVSHRAIGQISEDTTRAYQSGWQDLTNRLRTFVETGERGGIRPSGEAAS